MIAWCIRNGIPFDVAHCLEEGELLAYTIAFAKFENGGQSWNWSTMRFIEK